MPASRKNNIFIFLKFWLPVLLSMGFIFYSSSLPAKDIPPLFPYQDIIFHLFIYLVLAYFFSRALKNTDPRLTNRKIFYFTVMFTVSYALTDEFHQIFVSGRYASVFDLFIDGIGGLTGSMLYR